MATKISIVDNGIGADRFAFLEPEYQRAVYSSGEEMLKEISDPLPDLVLVNFCLPAMDGVECVRKLKARHPRLSVLMYSTDRKAENFIDHMENDLIFSAAHAGANGYLPKSLSLDAVHKTIEQVIQEARRHRRIFLMFFDSAKGFGAMAKHWQKIANLIRARSMNIERQDQWKKMTLVGKFNNAQSPAPGLLSRPKNFSVASVREWTCSFS